MSRILLLLIAFAVAGALARPAGAETLVLVDVPVSVEQAVRASLAPWGVEVVVAPAPAAYDPVTLAGERDAAFVAWRQGEELVLHDVATGAEERRPLSPAPDDAEAAAVALSIKTWMGLGPPPDGPPCVIDCAPPPEPLRRWLVELSMGARANLADTGGLGFRYGAAAGVRLLRYEAGLRVELGTERDAPGFGQDGGWAVTTVGGWGRAAFRVRPSVEVVPGVGVSLVSTSFQGISSGPGEHAHDDSTTAVGLDAELGARWRRGRLSAGARAGLAIIPQARYLKSRGVEHRVAGHVEPWLSVTMSVGL
jgi:hypothetical protein